MIGTSLSPCRKCIGGDVVTRTQTGKIKEPGIAGLSKHVSLSCVRNYCASLAIRCDRRDTFRLALFL